MSPTDSVGKGSDLSIAFSYSLGEAGDLPSEISKLLFPEKPLIVLRLLDCFQLVMKSKIRKISTDTPHRVWAIR